VTDILHRVVVVRVPTEIDVRAIDEEAAPLGLIATMRSSDNTDKDAATCLRIMTSSLDARGV